MRKSLMSRPTSTLTILVLSVCMSAGPLTAGTPSTRCVGAGARKANLQQTLEKGLQARRPEEFAFIREVVDLVEQGRLTDKLVRSTFQWARRRHTYPMPYFERALRIQARRLGVVIPQTAPLRRRGR